MGTLMYLPQSVGHHYRLVAEKHGVRADETALDQAFRMVWKQMPPRQALAGPRPDDDKGWWRDLVTRVIEMASPGSRVSADCFEEIYAHFAEPSVWRIYPEVPEVLATLSKKTRIGVISNFDKRLRAILDGLGVLGFFEHVILSSEAGADKPDPRIFELALATMGVPADHALHVGDDPVHDWEAASAAGMRIYKLERPGNSLAGVLGSL